MKESGAQFDDRIAEVVWVTNAEPEPHWKLMRFRDDKPNGNYVDIVESICRSIADGVEKEDVSTSLLSYRAKELHPYRPITYIPFIMKQDI